MFGSENNVTLSNLKSGFVVAGLQKINSLSSKEQEYFYDLGKRTNLLVFDEAHKAVAPTYQHLLNVFNPQERLLYWDCQLLQVEPRLITRRIVNLLNFL